MTLPKRLNFGKSSKQPLTPDPHIHVKIMLQLMGNSQTAISTVYDDDHAFDSDHDDDHDDEVNLVSRKAWQQ